MKAKGGKETPSVGDIYRPDLVLFAYYGPYICGYMAASNGAGVLKALKGRPDTPQYVKEALQAVIAGLERPPDPDPDVAP